MVTAMGRALEAFNDDRMEEGMDLIMDNIDFGVYVHKKVITEKRRERIKFKLPEDFKALAGKRFEPNESSILGDIANNVKQINETTRLSAQMDKTRNAGKKPPSRYNPYFRSARAGARLTNVTFIAKTVASATLLADVTF